MKNKPIKLEPENIKIIPWIDHYHHAYELWIGFTDYKNRKHYQLFSITINTKNGKEPEHFLKSAIEGLESKLNLQLKYDKGHFTEILWYDSDFHVKRWKAKKWWIANITSLLRKYLTTNTP